jgi:hypothetical protein
MHAKGHYRASSICRNLKMTTSLMNKVRGAQGETTIIITLSLPLLRDIKLLR